MFVEILFNTDGYIGGLATFHKKPKHLNGKLYELNESDTILLHQALVARDGVELVKKNEDINIGGVKLKFNEYKNKTIAKRIREENLNIKTHNKADEFIKYVNTK